MKKYVLLILTAIFYHTVFAQEQQTVKLSPKQIESIFIEQNLQLIAEHMNIDIAEAGVIQAKLWENPTLSIGDVSFWSSKSQREGESEVVPPLFGSFGKNTQFSIELSQLIQTAGKRGKLIKKEKLTKEIAIYEFEDILRGLKTELRASIYEIQYLQTYYNVLIQQNNSLSKLIDTHNKLVEQGNISINELLRLQSALLELENEINEVKTELNSQQKTLKALLNAEPFVFIEVEEENSDIKNPREISLASLIDIAMESRPDIKTSNLQVQYQEKTLAYEKALRVPDLTLSANYDRRGGVWRDFVGVGVSVDLPLFNRNQGSIKAAKIGKMQSAYLAQNQQKIVLYELSEAYNNYVLIYDFYKKISDNTLFSKLDTMLDNYTKNLLNRNISMLEYIDFMDSYKANKQTILSAHKKVNDQFEELQYTIGTDIK